MFLKQAVDELRDRVLVLFRESKDEALDLHQLFEAGGNEPEARARVLDVVERLVTEGLLEERGSDFYGLTSRGKAAAQAVKDLPT